MKTLINQYLLKEKIKKGELGQIFSIEAQMNGIHPPTVQKRRWLKNLKGGMMFFLGCHLVDLIVGILGEPKRIVPFNKCTSIDGVEANDYGFAIFEYENAVAFAKSCAQEIGGFGRRQLVVCGSEGTIELKPIEMHTEGGLYTDISYTTGQDIGEKTRSEVYNRYITMLTSFGEMIRGEKENPFTFSFGILSVNILLPI